MDPELKKLVEKLDPEDLRDLAALLGAGSLERQREAQWKHQLAEITPPLKVAGGIIALLGLLVFLVILMEIIGNALHLS